LIFWNMNSAVIFTIKGRRQRDRTAESRDQVSAAQVNVWHLCIIAAMTIRAERLIFLHTCDIRRKSRPPARLRYRLLRTKRCNEQTECGQQPNKAQENDRQVNGNPVNKIDKLLTIHRLASSRLKRRML